MLRQWRRPLCVCALVLCTVNLRAGDIAAFTDLGFSQDGRFYAFAQFGVEESTLFPWAEFFVVDVGANEFVSGGRRVYRHNAQIEVGQDGSGALYYLVAENAALAAKYGINFLKQGVPLFISLENGHNPMGDSIEFRDFDSQTVYRARLNPTVYGESSSFIINLERGEGMVSRSYSIGTPDVRRRNTSSYTIKKALIAPDRKSMVFVIEMTLNRDGAPDIRYMVETVRF